MIKFGTSGFRGIIGENFNKENVQRVAYALAMLISKEKIEKPIIDVGYDNRFMGDFFAKWVIEVLISYKIDVNFFEKSLPTPVIGFISKKHTFGIVLTASHNPYYYNGIKIIKDGGEIPDSFAQKIEKIANAVKFSKIKTTAYEDGISQKKICLVNNYEDYIKSVLSYINKKSICDYNPKILFNSMHGNSSMVIKEICKKIGFKNYEIMKESIDPYFEHGLPAPYLKNLTDQAKRVKDEKFDLGLALDGDSDRITCIDKSGEIYDCNYILTALFNYLVKEKKFEGGVVHNTAFTNLLSLVAKANDRADYVAKVGFKHISEIFKNTDAFIGGETNGIALKNHLFGKDGVLGAFLLIDLISYYRKNFKEILSSIEKKYHFKGKVIEFAYPITLKKKEEITDLVFIKKELPLMDRKLISCDYSDGVKYIFENGYWAMIRFSGNENVVRIFVEAENEKNCLRDISKLENFINVKERQ